jgi:predicted dithiol-disulfide oxidoreductase (DUF899 family)
MSELQYPNESREYREARESLLRDEQRLVDQVKAVAARRRNLPPGGQLKEDYVFQWANDGKLRLNESTRGRGSEGGRRFPWYPVSSQPTRLTTSARETRTTCSCR